MQFTIYISLTFLFSQLDGVNNLNLPPLERSYKSKSLAHYPENVSWNPFDAYGICMLSLPQGKLFSFSLSLNELSFLIKFFYF